MDVLVDYHVLSQSGDGEYVKVKCTCERVSNVSVKQLVDGFSEYGFGYVCDCQTLHKSLKHNRFLYDPLGLKFVQKYMKQAKSHADENDACHARHIGVVIAKVYGDGTSRILSTGYNGPPAKTPHCDSREYLDEMVWPQLTDQEKKIALKTVGVESDDLDHNLRSSFLLKASNCGQCPRRLIGAPSGTRLEICSCEHGERNALHNCPEDTDGAWMFCWCPVACWDCAKAIVQRRIKRVFFITDKTYGEAYQLDRSMFLFKKRGVHVVVAPTELYLG